MSAAPQAPVNIFPADAASITRIARLHAASFDEPWDEAALAGVLAMPGAFALVATADGAAPKAELAGFIIARVAADEAEILTVAVDIARRGQGLGRRLVEAAAATARAAGAVALFLEVAEDNVPALHLYERLGFRLVGLRPGYYVRGQTRVTARAMRLDLP